MSPLPSALIGHTGFVGSNLAAQHSFDLFFNSKNIEEIAGRSFDLLAIAGLPAAMWTANANPAADRAILDRLAACLLRARAKRVVLISTIAVYPAPHAVDEDSPIDRAAQTPYGRHRHRLEEIAAANFPSVLAVRLPGIYGPGLRKNAIFDLLHSHELYKIESSNLVQYYDLGRLWPDISIALAAGLNLVNFSTEPVTIAEIAKEAFGIDFANRTGAPLARFDMRSKHAALFHGRDGYLYARAQVLDGLRAFVRRERGQEISA